MGACRWPAGGIAVVLLMGCGPTLFPEMAIAHYAKPFREGWARRETTSPSSTAARLATPPDRTQVSLPESAESHRAEVHNAIQSGRRRSSDTIYQLQTVRWSQKYARTIYFTAIGYSPRMEPIWQMYGHYFLPGATANNPGAMIMYNQPLE